MIIRITWPHIASRYQLDDYWPSLSALVVCGADCARCFPLAVFPSGLYRSCVGGAFLLRSDAVRHVQNRHPIRGLSGSPRQCA